MVTSPTEGRSFPRSINAQTRLYPQFNNIMLQDVGSNSSYNALLVSYDHRLSQGFLVHANYTWGHAISDAPEVSDYDCDGVIEDPTDRNRDRSNSCIDRPSAFTLSGDFQPTWHGDSKPLRVLISNNDFTPTIVAESGIPQSIVSNNILNGDTTTGSVTRPLFIPRNSVRGPSITQVDLRYTRTLGTWFEYFRPQFFVESNNLFNKHSNITTLNDTATTQPLVGGLPTTSGIPTGSITKNPTFAYQSTLLQARILQFGAKFVF